MNDFIQAVPVWGEDLKNRYNQEMAFYCCIRGEKEEQAELKIAARSYYRLFLNGEIKAHGPARCAQHYCRVDRIPFTLHAGEELHIAIEVMAYRKPELYCNDCTMEPGMLIAEAVDSEGKILAATGKDFKCLELLERRMNVELMSHSRPILEFYDKIPGTDDWKWGKADHWENPGVLSEVIHFLPRRSKYPTLRPIPFQSLVSISDIAENNQPVSCRVVNLTRRFNPEWEQGLPDENRIIEALCREKESVFTGTFSRISAGSQACCEEHMEGGLRFRPGKAPVSCTWESRNTELGFVDFYIRVEKKCRVDLINADHRSLFGKVNPNTYVCCYRLQPGTYHLTTFEPRLARYIRIICRTEGAVSMSIPKILDDTYPDDQMITFNCSDGDLNRIYDGARRTLRLNTLDIFMDCPQRERGGWLCDSQFTGAAAWQMFGDLSVERDFIENFMLTDPDITWHSFFPEVYPGVHRSPEQVGIANWSFWLLTELADYYDRSGDQAFIDACRDRVSRFVEGLLSLRGDSGLIEGLPRSFVDWSLSNKPFAIGPISIPNNCLAVRMLRQMAELYHMESWRQAAQEMASVIETLDAREKQKLMPSTGDAAFWDPEKQTLCRGNCQTESGVALEIWSGFHREDDAYMRKFIYCMGEDPQYRPDPNLGRSNLFIGLMIRMDTLAGMGRIPQLVREMKHLYLPELRDGSGTFFENYSAMSGCHGFNAAAGTMLVNGVLGLGQPQEGTKTIVIAPNPCELRWAYGSALCSDGMIFFSWSADAETKKLEMQLQLPGNWKYELKKAPELLGWKLVLNGESL